jgi:hypothetical protein
MARPLRCPRCGERSDLFVRISSLAKLVRDDSSPDGLAIDVSEKTPADYEWVAFHCGRCGHEGPREDFELLPAPGATALAADHPADPPANEPRHQGREGGATGEYSLTRTLSRQQYDRMLEIVFGSVISVQGTESFTDLTCEQLGLLVEEGIADPEEAQNEAPTTREFYEYMQAHPALRAHGYVVAFDRSDCRLTIEGLECQETLPPAEQLDFALAFRYANELEVSDGGLYCWFD